ncbi:MAG: UDP-N-acetylmuramate--L-alanine ligase, partial [Prevotella sp.]|nr:UDP-N-acetylmuramate--L-alanine ligase [Prevotella sp.]
DNIKSGVEKTMILKDDVLNYVKSRDFDVLLVLGAGDLDNYSSKIARLIESKK